MKARSVEAQGDTHEAADELSPQERRRFGRLGGVLMIVGSLAAVPAAAFLDDPPDAIEHLLALAGVLAGVGLMVLPWERLPERALYLVTVLATGYVMVGVGLYSDDFAFYQVLIGVYTAYVRSGRVFLLLMGFFTLATLAPLTYANETFDEQAHHILVTLPVLMISAAVVRYLRDTLSQRELEYRRFAAEAVTLAERIRGGPDMAKEEGSEDVDKRLVELVSKTRS